jgi:hypothetical protein
VAWLDEQWPRLTFLTVFVPLHAADALSVQPPPQFAPNLFDGRFRRSFRKKEFATVYRLLKCNSIPYETIFIFHTTLGPGCCSSAESHY